MTTMRGGFGYWSARILFALALALVVVGLVAAAMQVIEQRGFRFPVPIHLGSISIEPHGWFELLAYPVGFQLYRMTRKRWRLPELATREMLPLLAGCIAGAALGSKLLAFADTPLRYLDHSSTPWYWLGGKTIVGGLLGGWIGVEVVKKMIGIRGATGDAFVFPLIVGMIIGRIGCFLAGPADDTWGGVTASPLGMTGPDGHPHLPLPLFEIGVLLLICVGLVLRMRRPFEPGRLFRLFILSYLTWRFGAEFLKDREAIYVGLSGIQVAAVVGALVTLASLRRRGVRLVSAS